MNESKEKKILRELEKVIDNKTRAYKQIKELMQLANMLVDMAVENRLRLEIGTIDSLKRRRELIKILKEREPKVAEDWIAGEPYWPKTPESKEGGMSKLNQGELLQILGIRFAGVCSKEEARAYEQIVALIKKPGVTEEWIEEKATQLIYKWFHKWREAYTTEELRAEAKDFIHSLVESLIGQEKKS